MGTKSWANFWDMTTDAGFRAIGSLINSNLTAVNASILTVTTDTGQINWTTVTKPVATNTVAGYEIWKFNDSQGTLYFKIEYGTASSATAQFSLWITIGTGSNGSGTITGIIGTRRQVSCAQNIQSTITNYTSHCCVVNGSFWLLLGEGTSTSTNSSCQAAFQFNRTGDSTGAVDNTGWFLQSTTTGSQTNLNSIIYWTTGAITRQDATNTVPKTFFVPTSITSSNFGTGGNNNYQVYRHQLPMSPEIKTPPLVGMCIQSEAPVATTTTMAIVGSTTHTFMMTGTAWGCNGADAGVNASFLLVYE